MRIPCPQMSIPPPVTGLQIADCRYALEKLQIGICKLFRGKASQSMHSDTCIHPSHPSIHVRVSYFCFMLLKLCLCLDRLHASASTSRLVARGHVWPCCRRGRSHSRCDKCSVGQMTYKDATFVC